MLLRKRWIILQYTLSAKATVGLLDHFEDELPHERKCKLSMSKRQVPALRWPEFKGIKEIAEYIIRRISEASLQENNWETRFGFARTPSTKISVDTSGLGGISVTRQVPSRKYSGFVRNC
jgi:hypothetical protein